MFQRIIKFGKIIALFLTISVLFCCAGCVSEKIMKKREQIFKQINDVLPRNTQYKFVYDTYYLDENGKTLFKDIVGERLKKDGKDVETSENFRTVRFQNNVLAFAFQYKRKKKLFGNEIKYFHAVGLIDLTDYSVSPYYFQNEHKKMSIGATQTHLLLHSNSNEKNLYDYVIINLESNEITEMKNVSPNVSKSYGEELTVYKPPRVYSVNDAYYNVYRTSLEDEEGNKIPVPTYEYVKGRSEELRKIDEILGGLQDDKVAAHFLTDGDELFVSYASDNGGFGIFANLYFTKPVIFKCDLTFEKFEYVACLDNVDTYNYDRYLEIVNTSKRQKSV